MNLASIKLLNKIIKNNKLSLNPRFINNMSCNHQNGNVHELARIGFSKEVENYETARPTYSNEAFKIALDAFELDKFSKNEKINVLDLAAGTGKFTRLLATQKNFNVYAVEPNKEMRKVLGNVSSVSKICDGTAASIPFDDGFFQIVFIAQAFHWFSNTESLREIHRVIKPQSQCKTGKSGLLLIWNMEDREAEAHVAELRDLYEKYDYAVPQYRKNEWKNVFKLNESLFSNLKTKFVKNDKIYLPVSHIWKRVLSKSYIASLSESEKSVLKEKVEQVIEKYKHLQIQIEGCDENSLRFPYYSEVTWCYNF